MCVKTRNYTHYKCMHWRGPSITVERCETAKSTTSWDTCSETEEREEELPKVAHTAKDPCRKCKQTRAWVRYTDDDGRLQWRKTVGAIAPPKKKKK